MFSVKITTWSLFGLVSKALATSKSMVCFITRNKGIPIHYFSMPDIHPLSKISFKPFTSFLVSLPSMNTRLNCGTLDVYKAMKDDQKKAGTGEFGKFVYVLIAKSKQSILDCSFPLIRICVCFWHIFFKDIRTSEWY